MPTTIPARTIRSSIHLFGKLRDLRTLALGQDDYFEYLISTARSGNAIPGIVKERLADSGLLFLGFRLDDWTFRALLQSIRARGGYSRLGDYKHVAVQLDPDDGPIEDPDMARRYLQRTAKIDAAQISIYRGSVESFVKEPHARRLQRA